MRCAEFETRLHDLLDHRARPDADEPLCAHARKCRPCGDLLYAQELLFEGLSGQARPDTPTDLAGRVLAELKTTTDGVERGAPSPSPTWARNNVLWAAAVLIAVGIGWYLNGLGQGVKPVPSDGTPGVVTHPANPGAPNNVQLATGPEIAIPQEYLNLMREKIDEMPARVDDVTTGLRPLTVPMEAAINALRNSIPNLHNAG